MNKLKNLQLKHVTSISLLSIFATIFYLWIAPKIIPPHIIEDVPFLIVLKYIIPIALLIIILRIIVFKDLLINYKLWILLISIFTVLPIIGEVGLRAGIALNISFLKNPILYSHNLSDDDFWKLQNKWQPEKALKISKDTYHPLLGWIRPKMVTNEFKSIPLTHIRIPSLKKSIIFYGDSFVVGETAEKDKIHHRLNNLLPLYKTYNYGVPGYGGKYA